MAIWMHICNRLLNLIFRAKTGCSLSQTCLAWMASTRNQMSQQAIPILRSQRNIRSSNTAGGINWTTNTPIDAPAHWF